MIHTRAHAYGVSVYCSCKQDQRNRCLVNETISLRLPILLFFTCCVFFTCSGVALGRRLLII